MKNKAISLMSLLSLITYLSILLSCSKDPEIIIQKETITIIDTIFITDTVTIIETIIQTVSDTTTTFILVRHAETTGSGSNPNLSAIGQARAQELQRILDTVALDAVYSTNFNRTTQTAQPTAAAKGLMIRNYDPFDPVALIDQTLASYPEGIILVVGHSNTTPDILNAMVGASTYADIPEMEYDNLFVVNISERGFAKVIHMKYGD
jgi:phosphohistidine phosphatase SixA